MSSVSRRWRRWALAVTSSRPRTPCSATATLSTLRSSPTGATTGPGRRTARAPPPSGRARSGAARSPPSRLPRSMPRCSMRSPSSSSAAVAATRSESQASGAKASGLASLTTGVKPITAQEHAARLAKLQGLMQQRGLAAFLVEAGSTLEYFTGVRWWRSERTTAALIPARGQAVVVTPFFEEPSIRQTLRIPSEVRPWKEDQNPFELLALALHDLEPGALAVETTTRFVISDRIRQAVHGAREVVSGEELVRACRMIKSPAELALLRAAKRVSSAALRHVHAHIEAGMRNTDLLNLLVTATTALGGNHEFSLVLLNEASAFPHGSIKPQSVREGSVVLIDTGCSVPGYQSDISRSCVFA